MFKADALKWAEGSVVRVAKAIGKSRSAVAQWGEIVPRGSAFELAVRTDFQIPLHEEHYPVNNS